MHRFYHPTPGRTPSGSLFRAKTRSSSGVALVIVLFAVALVSIVVLAYFSLAILNRNISFSSAGQARSNILALSALNFIKGDFIAEIQSGSTNEVDPAGSGVAIYLPTTNTTMVPYRMTSSVTPAPTAGTFPPNLVKWSSTNALWPATAAYNSQAGPVRASLDPTSSAPIPTTQGALSGHYIASSRWLKPDFGTNATVPTALLPQWVYMTRQGPLTNSTPAIAMSVLANSNATNSNYVVGRYAYAVYDEGGLLDVAAAGFSTNTFFNGSPSDPTDVGRKGNQGFADLTQLGLSAAQIDQLVGWRNASTWNSTTNYVGYLGTNSPSLTNALSSGFLKAAPGDQAFLSRQDLIQYWTTELQGSPSTNMLQYLTTFSREKNAPSWEPEHDANDPNSPTYWNGSNTDIPYDSVTWNDPSGGLSYQYHTNKDVTGTSSPNNRFFPNVRVKTTFTRLSGDTAVVGEPLVKNRFDLSKLAWITYKGPSGDLSTSDPLYNAAGTDANIYAYFGLTANYLASGVFLSWTYNHTFATVPTNAKGTQATDTNQIMTLDQVASLSSSLAREPDFFELMQATILRGSLGLCSGNPASPLTDSDIASGGEFYRAAFPNPGNALNEGGALYRPQNSDASTPPHVVNAQAMYQIIQIGANIIDQYTSDNFPTEIVLNGDDFYGVKNLPYISGIGDAALRVAPAPAYDITSTTDSAISSTTTQYQAYVHRWLDFALWNPHQNANNPPATGPAKIRISVVAGKEYPYIVNLGNFNPPSTPIPGAGTDYFGCIFEQPGTAISTATTGFVDGPAWIELNLNDPSYNNFTTPTTIGIANTSDPNGGPNINNPDGIITTSLGWQRSGIYLGWSKSPDNPYKVPPCVGLWPNYATSTAGGVPTLGIKSAGIQVYPSPSGLTIYLQYQDATSASVWHTYQELHNLYYSRNTGSGDAWMETKDPQWTEWTTVPPFNPPPSTANTYTVSQIIDGHGAPATYNGAILTNMDTCVVGSLDPRSVRVNLWSWHNGAGIATGGSGTDSMVTSTVNMVGEPSKGVATGPHFQNPTNASDATWTSAAETWVDNISISPMKNYDYSVGGADPTSYYRDRDYIPRLGDAAGWTNVVLPPDASGSNPTGASPLNTGAQMQRPLQLDRPFRSVAEIGYVFRDDPWKTLNLFSANSADAGLMDIFCIGAGSTNSTNVQVPDVVAGKMNINSAAANAASAGSPTTSLVIQSLLSQTLRDYKSPSGAPTTLDTSIATASNIQVLSGNVLSYMKTNGPLMNIADVSSIFPQVTAASPPTPIYTGLKNPSEALVRSLADSSGTRTWNLMIDVIAQAGKFNPTAAGLSSFTVEGEKHYWLHVAIDRFTGEIVAQQLEPVWE